MRSGNAADVEFALESAPRGTKSSASSMARRPAARAAENWSVPEAASFAWATRRSTWMNSVRAAKKAPRWASAWPRWTAGRSCAVRPEVFAGKGSVAADFAGGGGAAASAASPVTRASSAGSQRPMRGSRYTAGVSSTALPGTVSEAAATGSAVPRCGAPTAVAARQTASQRRV